MKRQMPIRFFLNGTLVASLLLAGCAPAAPTAAPIQPTRPAPQAQPTAPAAAPTPTAAPAAVFAPTAAPRPSPTPQPTPTATPIGSRIRKGGVLAQALFGGPSDLDLLGASSVTSLATLGLSYDGLVKEDPLKPGQLAPDLAERWSISGDGARVTFFLRKGVTFHSGKAFTSADAKASVERWMTDTGQLAGTLGTVIKSVDAPDSSTLNINLKFAYPDLFKSFMMDWASVVPADQGTGKDVKTVNGTGAFKFKSYQSGVAYQVVRNDKYWNKDLPNVDGVTVYILADRSTGLAAFRAGRIDLMSPIYPTVAQYRTIDSQLKGQATAYLYPTSFWWNFYMNIAKGPWKDARVRKAAFIAIDRKQSVETVDQGLGSTHGVLPPVVGGMDLNDLKSIPGWRDPKSKDIDEAKKLLADAGYPSGFKTDIFYQSQGEIPTMAVFVKDQLAKVGIDATLTTRVGSAFYDYLSARSYQTHLGRQAFNPASPDTILAQFYQSGGIRNYADIADKKLDAMIDRQMSTANPQERAKQLRAIETYLYDNGLAGIISWGNYSQAWSKSVRDFFPGETVYNNVRLETVWLDK